MPMTSKERVLQRERNRGWTAGKEQGKVDALDLAKRAKDMDGTAIIAEEHKIPLFIWGTDYSGCPVGAPIAEIIDGEVQIFTMITPINTAHYPGITPNTMRSLYSLRHTKDPAKAKPWIASQGTSGLYETGECCTYNGKTWRNLHHNNEYPPETIGVENRWEEVTE